MAETASDFWAEDPLDLFRRREIGRPVGMIPAENREPAFCRPDKLYADHKWG
jgi:hypothetical protein